MEMFETDVQLVLNEYLQNLIREKNFIKETRASNNHSDYKPMIEHSREQGMVNLQILENHRNPKIFNVKAAFKVMKNLALLPG